MSESMVERVARALYDATPFRETEGGFDEQSEVYRDTARLLARAAIEAMREPTEAMDVAGQSGRYQKYGGVLTSWRAMIDAALT